MNAGEARTVLVVDDDARNLRLLSDALSDAGFEVAVAVNGQRAFLLAREMAPDLILLDVKMEGLDGFETCRLLKEDASTHEIPVIFLTISADRMQGLKLGAVDFVLKPFQMEELVARVQVHTKLRSVTKHLAAQVEERLAAEAALQALTQDLEARVARRTVELERAQAALRALNVQLETEVARQTEELRQTNERLKIELLERERAEAARAALQEEIIRAQEARLAELSTPLIPITEQIMVMPLIGTIDASRAKQALGVALHGVEANRANVVIIDVTGVTTIDSAVASTLVGTAAALRLLGAKTVVTGLRPKLAQTLVALDIDLSGLVTMGTLKSGIDYALWQGEASRAHRGARGAVDAPAARPGAARGARKEE